MYLSKVNANSTIHLDFSTVFVWDQVRHVHEMKTQDSNASLSNHSTQELQNFQSS